MSSCHVFGAELLEKIACLERSRRRLPYDSLRPVSTSAWYKSRSRDLTEAHLRKSRAGFSGSSASKKRDNLMSPILRELECEALSRDRSP